MNNLDEIKKTLNNELEKYPVAFAYVFGSVARGQTHKDSDLDIALGFSRPISDDLFYEIFSVINRALNISSEKLDIKNFNELPLALRFRVVRDGKLIFLKDIAAQRVAAVRAISQYHDEKPFFNMATQAFFKRKQYERN